MQAYLGDAGLKQRLVAEILKHEQANQIVSGTYGEQRGGAWVGCAIGCALHSLNALEGKPLDQATDDHARFPTELGIPLELAYHIENVFEQLPQKERVTWPRRVAEAIRPAADLEGVMPALLQWMILDKAEGWITLAETAAERASFRKYAKLVAQDWAGDTVTEAQWDKIDAELARARAWARARARARARAGAEAWAWAWAWAGADYDQQIVKLSLQTLQLLKAAR